jgi:hypothetical protein
MSWKVKKEYKGHKPINFNLPLDELSQSQIEGLSPSHRDLYFGKTSKLKKGADKHIKIEEL